MKSTFKIFLKALYSKRLVCQWLHEKKSEILTKVVKNLTLFLFMDNLRVKNFRMCKKKTNKRKGKKTLVGLRYILKKQVFKKPISVSLSPGLDLRVG